MENQTHESRWKRFLKTKRQFLIGLVVGLIVAASVTGGVMTATGAMGDDTGGEIENIRPGDINVTDMQAREAVLEAYPNADITEVDLDAESGTIVYDVGIDNGSEIMVDAKTGEILGIEQDDADNGRDDNDGGADN